MLLVAKRAQAHTHKPTLHLRLPGPKLNPRKILLFLRLFITAVLRHVRQGKEQERQGTNTKWRGQGSEGETERDSEVEAE